jgi:uncharacterized protein (TIGR03083 family)
MTAEPGKPSFEELRAALGDSHQRLAASVGGLTPQQVTAPSYADEWSIAQVLSHLGSGAEIFEMILDAGLAGGPPPGMADFQAVWSRWDAEAPADQASGALAADAQFLDRLGGLTEAERDRWRMELFGAEQDLGDVASMRLGEHALHTWDVTVTFDPETVVPASTAALLVDRLDALVARVGKPDGRALRVQVVTDEPDRRFFLETGPDGARLTPTRADAAAHDATLRLPAEALVRLVYGRLDPDHTPTIEQRGVDLDTLRAVFPGF